jgi:oligopeptide/dipeptide ABC transporter ATP-binding protein
MSLLELRDVHVGYRRPGRATAIALAGVSLTLEQGEVLGLVGETGCGKSTLARVAVGLQAPSSGSVFFQGQQLRPIGLGRRAPEAARLQLVFQNPFGSLNPRRKVGDQIGDAIRILSLRPRNQRKARVLELLHEVAMPPEAADSYPHEFSGGQRQRIAIARALAAEPSAIVMDEPLSALDASAQAQIVNLLARLAHDMRMGLLVVSHDLSIIRQIADSVAVMYHGVIVEIAPTKSLWLAPKHPYTKALIKAIPRLDGSGELPEALPGEVPDPAHPPVGCRFQPRCPQAFGRCTQEEPQLVLIEDRWKAACWLA